MIMCRLYHRSAKSFRANSFFIIRKNNSVKTVIQFLLDKFFQNEKLFVASRRNILKIHSEHLRMPAHNTNFCCSRFRGGYKPFAIYSLIVQKLNKRLKIMIVADETRKHCFTTENRQVVGNIRSRSQRRLSFYNFRDRYGRVAGKFMNVAVIIFVHHHIADNKDFALSDLFGEKLFPLGFIHIICLPQNFFRQTITH